MSKNTYFVNTGFPKSGNSWFEMLLYEKAGINGFYWDFRMGLPITVQLLIANKKLDKFLKERKLSIEIILKKLLNTEEELQFNFNEKEREEIREIMREILPKARKIKNNFYPDSDVQHLSINRLIEPFFDPENKEIISPQRSRIFGCPSKHMRVQSISCLLPSFKIIQIIRDPRDVLVSFFYHDMAYMTPEMINIFTKKSFFGGKIKTNPNWMRIYFNRKIKWMYSFYENNFDVSEEKFLPIKYEEMLSNTVGKMRKILDFLGCSYEQKELEKIVCKYSFETITGGTSERKNSFIRKGQAGDWNNYFDKRIIRKIDSMYLTDLLKKLGYEDNDAWINQLPDKAPQQFDFSRFRIKRSTCNFFIGYWYESEEVQKTYPNPFDVSKNDSYYNWLRRLDKDEVQQWFADAERLLEFWNVNIEDDMYH